MTDYAGELTLDEAWSLLRDDERAVLVDVRTKAEWDQVGIPLLDELDKQPRMVEWVFPGGVPNQDFLADASAGLDTDIPVMFLCRSGVRSLAAAKVFTAAGYSRALNITAGFEGDLDPDGRRTTGWRHCGLPWR